MIRIGLFIGALLISPLILAQVSVEEAENMDSVEVESHLTVDQRIHTLERQMRNQMDLLKRNQALTQQLKDLQGQLEVQSHEISILKEQQKSQYSDVDQRLTQLSHHKNDPIESSENKKTKTSETNVKKSTTTDKDKKDIEKNSKEPDKKEVDKADKKESEKKEINKKDGSELYQTAYAQLKNKNYDKAQTNFKKFIRTYPNDSNIVSAHYWLGFIYLLKSEPENAIAEFKTVIKLDVKKERAPEATRKIALARSMQKKETAN